MSDHQSEGKREPRVVIVGAGLGGISAAVALKKQLGFSNFTIYERGSGVGGTWRDTTYPGCGSDVPGHWYCLSTELNPSFSSYYVDQPELQAYWENVWKKHNLQENTVLNMNVHSSEWDDSTHRYKIALEDVKTRRKSETEAEFMIYAIGGFMSPSFPKDMNLAKFRGPAWHSSRWRHDVALSGKRVGVLGNGCSAAQFIPKIASDPTVQVYNFCRTPQWFIPRRNTLYPSWVKWTFAHIPFLLRLYRISIFLRSDLGYLIFHKNHSLLGKVARWAFIRYIKKTAPKDYWNHLIPNYPPGCKRIIVDPNYLSCLHQTNVHLVWDDIDSLVEEGIKLKTGQVVPLDIVIFGTGYSVAPIDLHIRGRHEDIQTTYAARGGPEAYLGCTVPGFPNLFTLLGPNVASGHASVIFSEEVQIDLAVKVFRHILNGDANSIEIKEEFANDYNLWLHDALSRTVWTDCQSYYQLNGKNVSTFPGAIALQWWIAKRNSWDNWNIVGGNAWAERRRRNNTIASLLLVSVSGVLAALYTRRFLVN